MGFTRGADSEADRVCAGMAFAQGSNWCADWIHAVGNRAAEMCSVLALFYGRFNCLRIFAGSFALTIR